MKKIMQASWSVFFVLLLLLPTHLPAVDEPLRAEESQTPPSIIEVPFNEKELKGYGVRGQSSITGVAFGRTVGGNNLL